MDALRQIPTETSTLIAVVALLLCVVLIVLVTRLQRRLNALMRGSTGASLESDIASMRKEYQRFTTSESDIHTALNNLDARLKGSVRGVATVRFNPFDKQEGGKQSFATALLAEGGTGVVLSSLYIRGRVSVFAKPITNFESTHELSTEELQALKEARRSLTSRTAQTVTSTAPPSTKQDKHGKKETNN